MSEIYDNKEKSRFEMALGTEYAYLDYRWLDNNLALMHTFVPISARGEGIAHKFAKFALEYVREKNIKAIVYCPFVAAYLKRHPEYNYLITQRN